MKDFTDPQETPKTGLEMEQYLKEHVSNNRSQIEEIQSTLETIQSRLDSIEEESGKDVEDEISKLSSEMEVLSSTVSDSIEELESRIEKLENGEKGQSIDDITEKEIENRIEKKIERKSFDELNKIQKLESRIDQLEDRVNLEDLEELDLEMAARGAAETDSGGSSSTGKKSSSGGSKQILTPADISADMSGQEVKIKGELEYRKEASGNKFYRLSGSATDLIVRSDHSIPEGRRILNGEVELIKGNLCIHVEE